MRWKLSSGPKKTSVRSMGAMRDAPTFLIQASALVAESTPVAWMISIWLEMRSLTTSDDMTMEPLVRLNAGMTALTTAAMATTPATVSMTVAMAFSMAAPLYAPTGGRQFPEGDENVVDRGGGAILAATGQLDDLQQRLLRLLRQEAGKPGQIDD